MQAAVHQLRRKNYRRAGAATRLRFCGAGRHPIEVPKLSNTIIPLKSSSFKFVHIPLLIDRRRAGSHHYRAKSYDVLLLLSDFVAAANLDDFVHTGGAAAAAARQCEHVAGSAAAAEGAVVRGASCNYLSRTLWVHLLLPRIAE